MEKANEVEKIVANALAWARARLGATEYATRCLAFVEDAYEQANALEVFGGDTAHESAVQYGAGAASGEPPAGAFVFYDCAGELRGEWRNWGHVGLATGDGAVIHAWNQVRVDAADALLALRPPPGWTPLAYVGWVPPERILLGHRPRDWSAEP